MTTRTPAAGLFKPNFNALTWHDQVNANFDTIDALLSGYVAVQNVQGVWQNYTDYSIGQVLVDSQNGFLYECLEDHTSAISPTTFADDRSDHPSYWSLKTSFATYKGLWTTATDYNVGDFIVNDNATVYAVCNTDHTSTDFDDDAAYWDKLIDAEALFTQMQSDAATAAYWGALLASFSYDIHDFSWLPNRRWSEQVTRALSVTGSYVIDLSLGNVFDLSLSGTTTLSLTGYSELTTLSATAFTLYVTHNNYCVVWPSNVYWPGNAEPTQEMNGTSLYTFATRNGGATWQGAVAGTNYPA
jgi:hypothetical protein